MLTPSSAQSPQATVLGFPSKLENTQNLRPSTPKSSIDEILETPTSMPSLENTYDRNFIDIFTLSEISPSKDQILWVPMEDALDSSNEELMKLSFAGKTALYRPYDLSEAIKFIDDNTRHNPDAEVPDPTNRSNWQQLKLIQSSGVDSKGQLILKEYHFKKPNPALVLLRKHFYPGLCMFIAVSAAILGFAGVVVAPMACFISCLFILAAMVDHLSRPYYLPSGNNS